MWSRSGRKAATWASYTIDSTTRLAQKQFNRWLDLDEAERSPTRLVEMLGFDYFTLLDVLTIARSRKHVEKYYGTAETGRFPDRLKPINIKADVDRSGQFRPIREINLEIRRLNLASYAPLAPHFLVHVGDDGAVLLPYPQAKQVLDRLKRLCLGRELPDAGACARFDKITKQGQDMKAAQRLLAAAVASVVGKSEERAVASLFFPGRHPRHEGGIRRGQRLRGGGVAGHPARVPGMGCPMTMKNGNTYFDIHGIIPP